MSTFGGKKFDIVYHCDVISHLFDPVSEFIKTHQKMEDGGVLIFETGNLGDVKQKYFRYFNIFQYPDHLFFFGTNNLIELLEKSGFDLIKIYRYSVLPQLIARKAVFGILNAIRNLVLISKRQERPSSIRSRDVNLSDAVSQSSNLHYSRKRQFPYSSSWYILGLCQ